MIAATAQTTVPQGKTYDLDVKKAPKTKEQLAEGAKLTTNTALYKGEKYPVYLSKNSKLFVIVQAQTSKNWYRKYIYPQLHSNEKYYL